jgi:tetratricopeptide (TPR) repeat protein
MNFLRGWIGLAVLLVSGAVPGNAQSPDDRYLRVYSLIEQGDQLSGRNETRAAVNRYLEAQVALKELQQTYPSWNPRIVGFRLEYISGKLAPLTRETGPGLAGDKTAGSGGPTNSTEILQGEIAKLAEQNAYLEARLREALKVQPASTDPRELNRAEERIRALQKERDLLAVTLEQTRVKPAPGASPAAQAEAEQQQRVTHTAVADVLRKQNDELQKRIAELQIRLQGGREALPLKEAIAALQASNRVMKAEQVAMENRLLELVKSFHSGSSQREKEWEARLAEARAAAEAAKKERDSLLARLDAVTRELNKAPDKPNPANAAAAAELERQLESIRAKLEIFEARAVPYSSEELVLFRQAPLKVAAEQVAAPPAPVINSNTTAATPARRDLPPGAGALLRDAERATDGGRFDEAESRLQEIVRQDPNQPFVLAKLAAVQMDQDKSAAAEETLKKALVLDPQDPACLYLMGSLKVRQEKYDDGITLLSQTVKLAPDNAQARFFLAKALIQKGQRKPAETELRNAIRIKPGWGEAHYLLAVIYATQEPNFKGLAQFHYKKAIAGGAPRNPDLERWMERPAPNPK